jgi:hypothetical protein
MIGMETTVRAPYRNFFPVLHGAGMSINPFNGKIQMPTSLANKSDPRPADEKKLPGLKPGSEPTGTNLFTNR